MKKFFLFLCVALFVVGLFAVVGCGEKKATEKEEGTEYEQDTGEEASEITGVSNSTPEEAVTSFFNALDRSDWDSAEYLLSQPSRKYIQETHGSFAKFIGYLMDDGEVRIWGYPIDELSIYGEAKINGPIAGVDLSFQGRPSAGYVVVLEQSGGLWWITINERTDWWDNINPDNL